MVRARFAELMQPVGRTPPLDEAALLISSALQPGLDVDQWLGELDELAAVSDDRSAEGVADHLFGDRALRGQSHGVLRLAQLVSRRVIATRTGIPISLSVLMIEVAGGSGSRSSVSGMPAHFLVRSTGDPELFVDPFHGDVGSIAPARERCSSR